MEEDENLEEDLLEEEEIERDDESDNNMIVAKREEFELAMKSNGGNWGYSKRGIEAKRAAMTMLSTKTGMYARIPLICKGKACPYAESCELIPYDLTPVGEPCPKETSKIEMNTAGYCQDLDYEHASFTDKMMLNDLVGYDIMLDRCRSLMAKEGTPVIEIVAGVAENGEEIRQPAISKALEAYEKIVKKKNETYQLMMMTRKDKKKNGDDEDGGLQDILNNVINAADLEEE
jgi:hypothetical protein